MSLLNTEFKALIIKEAANDLLKQYLNQGKEGIKEIFSLIYGQKEISDDEIESFQKILSKYKLNNQQNVINKLVQILSQSQLKHYDKNTNLSQLFNQQAHSEQDNLGLQSNSNQTQKLNGKSSNSLKDEKLNNDNKVAFLDQIKPKKARISQIKKYIYSDQVEQLIENTKKIFWNIDMERSGQISTKDDLNDFLISFQQELSKNKIEMDQNELKQNICKSLNIEELQRIEIDNLEKIVIHFISEQTNIQLYKI